MINPSSITEDWNKVHPLSHKKQTLDLQILKSKCYLTSIIIFELILYNCT